MNTTALTVAVSALIATAVGMLIARVRKITTSRRALLARYFARPCSGRAWQNAFPDASKDDLRTFLGIFADAFLFRPSESLCFRPDDRITEIYRSIYPSKTLADALEWETLRNRLESKSGQDLSAYLTEEVTLGGLFDKTR